MVGFDKNTQSAAHAVLESEFVGAACRIVGDMWYKDFFFRNHAGKTAACHDGLFSRAVESVDLNNVVSIEF